MRTVMFTGILALVLAAACSEQPGLQTPQRPGQPMPEVVALVGATMVWHAPHCFSIRKEAC